MGRSGLAKQGQVKVFTYPVDHFAEEPTNVTMHSRDAHQVDRVTHLLYPVCESFSELYDFPALVHRLAESYVDVERDSLVGARRLKLGNDMMGKWKKLRLGSWSCD